LFTARLGIVRWGVIVQDPKTRVTQVLQAVDAGNSQAAEELFPLVYDELRRLAASLLASENGPLTLQPTGLVHEAYMRLVGSEVELSWTNRSHFFNTAARAMRRILIDRARRLKSAKGGAGRQPYGQHSEEIAEDSGHIDPPDGDDLLLLDTALESLRQRDERQHEVVMLRYFAGLTIEQAAAAMSLSPATVKADWTFARAWLMREMRAIRGEQQKGRE
jgi:RNA polymerase sigma factor (TIGR02999 family)